MNVALLFALFAAVGAEMSCSNDFCNSLNNDHDMYKFGQLVVEDESCLDGGGIGCNAQGKSKICRFCTWQGDHKTPTCPQCACDRLNLTGCGSLAASPTPAPSTPASVEVNAEGSCRCYYGDGWHNCNHSPFAGDKRCVCGPKKSDWKTPEQCEPPNVEVNAEGSCPCYYGDKWHYCNHSPFKGDTRCVCGPKKSDWKTPEQCEPPNVEVNAKGSCPCYYGGKTHHCNHSPFKGDTRCVCGPKRSDWKTQEECQKPVSSPPAEMAFNTTSVVLV